MGIDFLDLTFHIEKNHRLKFDRQGTDDFLRAREEHPVTLPGCLKSAWKSTIGASDPSLKSCAPMPILSAPSAVTCSANPPTPASVPNAGTPAWRPL